MKSFVGGITNSNDQIHLNLCVDGGTPYVRVYEDNVSAAIHKIHAVSDALVNLPIDSYVDAVFHIEQIISLFHSANIEFLYGSAPYQYRHNAQVLRVYLNNMTKKFDASDILGMLGLTKILLDLNKDVSLRCPDLSTDNLYLYELIEDDKEDLVIVARQLRSLVITLCSMIDTNRSEIQTAYEDMLKKVNAYMKEQ